MKSAALDSVHCCQRPIFLALRSVLTGRRSFCRQASTTEQTRLLLKRLVALACLDFGQVLPHPPAKYLSQISVNSTQGDSLSWKPKEPRRRLKLDQASSVCPEVEPPSAKGLCHSNRLLR